MSNKPKIRKPKLSGRQSSANLSPEEDGETILDWASDNGFGASPIVDALIDRI